MPGAGAEIVASYRAARPDASPPDLFFAIETDRLFRIPAVRLAEAQCAHQPRTYAYLFTWESPMLGGSLGACHGVDVPFVLGGIGTKHAERFAGSGTDAEALCAAAMDAWLCFARDGDPGHAGLPEWPGFDSERRPTLLFGARPELALDPHGVERAAWEGRL